MATKITPKDFVEALKDWSVLDVVEAVKAIEDEFGIKAATAVAAAPAAAVSAQPEEPEEDHLAAVPALGPVEGGRHACGGGEVGQEGALAGAGRRHHQAEPPRRDGTEPVPAPGAGSSHRHAPADAPSALARTPVVADNCGRPTGCGRPVGG